MNIIINECSAKLKIPKAEKISKEMGVFYNPIMGLNRGYFCFAVKNNPKITIQNLDAN